MLRLVTCARGACSTARFPTEIRVREVRSIRGYRSKQARPLSLGNNTEDRGQLRSVSEMRPKADRLDRLAMTRSAKWRRMRAATDCSLLDHFVGEVVIGEEERRRRGHADAASKKEGTLKPVYGAGPEVCMSDPARVQGLVPTPLAHMLKLSVG